MNHQPYFIPEAPTQFKEEIKKSLFITQLAHTTSVDDAKAFIEQVKIENKEARHHCWAFVAGRPENSVKWGCSDDGEPSRTAGKPMLAQLSGSNIGEITAVVTRYYGGVLLGTGGLVKAYGGGVQKALKQLQIIERKITTNLYLTLDYSFMPIAKTIMEYYSAIEISARYTTNVELVLDIELRHVEAFTQMMINKSSAKVIISTLKKN